MLILATFIAPTLLPAAVGAQPAAPTARRVALDLKWSEAKPDGSLKDLPAGPAKQAAASPAKVGRRKLILANGTAHGRTLEAMDVTTFRGPSTFVALLPAEIRTSPVYVRFMLNAAVGSTPEAGTIINVDGAIIGYRSLGGNRVQLVTADVDANGNRVWHATGFTLTADRQQLVSGSPKLSVKLDAPAHRWSLFLNDILLEDNLPLFSTANPIVSIRPGILAGDTAELKDFHVATKPYPRPAKFLPVGADGKIDLASAVKNHDPRVHAPTE